MGLLVLLQVSYRFGRPFSERTSNMLKWRKFSKSKTLCQGTSIVMNLEIAGESCLREFIFVLQSGEEQKTPSQIICQLA